MPNSGNLFPGTAETIARGAGTAWSNPSNAASDNAIDAICTSGGSGSAYLVLRNFGVALSTGDTVSGITIRIEASEHSGGTEVLSAQLQNDAGVLIGTPKTITLSGTAKVVYTYGGIADLWGAALTPEVVNSPNFGVRFWFTTAHDVRIDFVTGALEYVLAPVVPGGPIFPGPIFPGPIFPGPIFPGAGTGEIADSLSSVTSTTAVGTVLPATHKTLPGVTLSAAVGFITTVENTVVLLSGVTVTATVNTIVGERSKALTGIASTIAAVGSVSKSYGVSLIGVTASIGTGVSGSADSAWGNSWGNSWGTSWGAGTSGSGSSWGTSWGDSWGGSWGAGVEDPGIGNVIPNTSVTAPGNEVDVTVDAVSEARLQALTSVTLQAQVGFLAADPNAVSSLTGVAVQVEVGTLQAPLVGNAVTVSVGTVLATVVFGLTGVEAAETNGSLIAEVAAGLTGLAVQVALQSLQASRTASLSGVTVTVAVGSPYVPSQLTALTGVGLSADVGSLALEKTALLSGVDVTADVDIVTTTADREQSLIGLEVVSVDVGFITAQNDVLAILTGVDIGAAVGTVEALRIKTLDGVALSAAVGSIVPVPHRTAALSGISATVQTGAIHRDAIPLTGVAAGATVESLGQPLLIRVLNPVQVTVNVGHTPKEGDVILDTVGVLVGAGTVGILGVIPSLPVGTYRHNAPTPIRKRSVKDLETLEREMALMEE